MTARRLAIVPLLLASAACARGDDTPAAADGGPWTVERVLSVGGTSGDSVYEFGAINGVDTDSAGNLYVADLQAQTVRVYDAAGTYLRSIGHEGSGPGELGAVFVGVHVFGDEVLVPDLANQRVSRFALDGTYLSSDRLDLSRGIPLRFDVTAGGRLVAQLRQQPPPEDATGAEEVLVVLVPEGQPVDTLATVPSGRSVQIGRGLPVFRPFAADPVWDSDDSGRLVTATTDAWRLEVWDPGAASPRVLSRPWEPVPVTAADRQAAEDGLRSLYERQGAPPRMLEAMIAAMEPADHLPAFTSVFLGPNGSVWVQQVGEGRLNIQDMGSATWDVFDSSGQYVGEVSFPQQFQPYRALGDRIYGVGHDALDVQTVEVYRVVTG